MSAFSSHNPKLRLAWDSSSLGELMFCPYRYKLTYVDGWRGDQVDLQFGGFFASAVEVFHKARCDNLSLDDATLLAVQHALNETWIDGRPWGGHYETEWRCTGETAYRNAKGNRAKCPYSHKGVWLPAPSPGTCGECGSPTVEEKHYIPNHKTKNRITLLRLVSWYCLSQPTDYDAGLRAYVFPDGTPAIELSFVLPTPWSSPYGEPYLLAGHLDKIASFGETEKFIVDNKTTTKSLTNQYFQTYSPNHQFDTYDMVGSLLFPDLDLQGIYVEAASISAKGAEFGLRKFTKTEEQRQEHLENIGYWIKQAEAMAENDYFPMNKRNCFLCPLKTICSKPASERDHALREAGLTQGPVWNPTETR